ncbi:substrate-binding periplasmic protein [Undibacterium sp. TJN25]|uniref:substrate-binding periplasmic protein n=1 Tax=Undibacterium sp. TJN25 TaxID=3413056 RepID=UPI003BF1C8C6
MTFFSPYTILSRLARDGFFARKTAAALLFALCLPALAFAQLHPQSPAPLAAKAPLVFAVSVDQGPSAIMAQRILLEAYRQLGIRIRFEALPNPRIVALAAAGGLDGVDFRIADTPLGDMQKIGIPIAYEELVVFSLNPHIKINGYRSLQGYLTGYLSGARIVEDQLKGMPADTAPNLESLFNKLQAGRTDIVIDSRSSYCKAKMMGLDKVVMLEPPLEKLLGYHWLSVRHQALIPRLDAVLKKMKRDDTMKKLQDDAWRDFNAQCRV